MAAVLDSSWQGQNFSPPTPLDIATLEAAIVARLRSSITAVEVAHFPDDPRNYRLTHRTGAALVVYRGAKYSDVEDTGAIIQQRILEFEVTLLIRDLGSSVGGPPGGGRPGTYSVLEAIRTALTGFQVPGARKMYPTSEKFLQRDPQGGVWMYAISFALSTMAVETALADEFPLFIKGVAEESGGETPVAAAAEFTFDSQNQIQLPNTNVLAVTLTASGGGLYESGVDYSLDSVNGVVTRIASGTIPVGATVQVRWSYADSVVATAQ